MRLQKKSLSRVTLESLLRKKKTDLESFLKETGIATYDRLAERCASIGVVPPTEDQFQNAKGNPVTHEFSSPMEGIVVMNPIEETVEESSDKDTEPEVFEESTQSKKKKKRSSTDTSA